MKRIVDEVIEKAHYEFDEWEVQYLLLYRGFTESRIWDFEHSSSHNDDRGVQIMNEAHFNLPEAAAFRLGFEAGQRFTTSQQQPME